jgi:hypothetical protein
MIVPSSHLHTLPHPAVSPPPLIELSIECQLSPTLQNIAEDSAAAVETGGPTGYVDVPSPCGTSTQGDEINADHPARPATDAQAVAAIGGDVNGAIIDREPLRVVAGVAMTTPGMLTGCLDLAIPSLTASSPERQLAKPTPERGGHYKAAAAGFRERPA